MEISFCIITLNEEDNIEKLIRNIKQIADEIIIVDCGSDDKTVEIAKSLGAKVIFNEWKDYSTQKNLAISKASKDWVFVLDADERLSDKLKENILSVKERETHGIDGFLINRKTFYLGKFINHSGWYPDTKVRLFKKRYGSFYGKYVHEGFEFNGKAKKLKGDVLHYSYKNIGDHIERIKKYSCLYAKRMKTEGKKFSFLKLLFNPLFGFIKHYFLKLGFLDGFRGFVISVLTSYYVFLKYLFLWEIERNENTSC